MTTPATQQDDPDNTRDDAAPLARVHAVLPHPAPVPLATRVWESFRRAANPFASGTPALEMNCAGRLHVRYPVRFADVFGMTAQQAAGILSRGLPPGIRFALTPVGTRFCLDFNTRPHIQDEGLLDRDTGMATHDYAFVTGTSQRCGLGRVLSRNRLEFCRAAGMTRITLRATSSVGGYMWARCGYLPATDQTRAGLRDQLESRMDLLSSFPGTDALCARLAPLVMLDRPTDLWRIADLADDMMPVLRAAETRAHAMLPPWRHCHDHNLPLTLGQAMLLGTSWDGRCDLTDPVQMTRAGAYNGGWKHLNI